MATDGGWVGRLRAAAALAIAIATVTGCGGSGSSSPSGATPASPGSSASLVTTPATKSDGARFLTQTSFGPTTSAIDTVMAAGYAGWLESQFAIPHAPVHLDYWNAQLAAAPSGATNDWIYQSFWRTALTAEDQLRHRVAFALSQIFVVSLVDGAVGQHPRGVASYLDMLGRHAFGNFRQLLEDVALHPMMGLYLSHLRNQGQTGRTPDENFAREVMQLFTIGLHALNPDGSVQRDAAGKPVETYTNDDVTGLARVFTGFSWAGPDTSTTRFNGGSADPNRDVMPMQPYPQFHASGEKRFLGGVCAAQTAPQVSLACALDRLFQHPNVGPFFGRQLIQRLVTSNPSPAYVGRVAAAFADNGSGVRGDMKAVLRAVLLDAEARLSPSPADTAYGKAREPVLRLSALLRATGASSASGRFLIGSTDNTVSSLGQTPMRAPSVFNFWRPGYTPPNGGLATGGLVAPELQATNETSVAAHLNLMQTTIQSGIGSGSPRDVQPTLAELQALAHDADALLDRIDLLLASGQTSVATRQRIRDVVNSIAIPLSGSSDTARRNRTMVALLLTVASPEFQTQR